TEHIIELPALGFGNGSWLCGLSARVKEADVVHLHYPYYGTAEHIARLRKKGRIKRLAMTLHMDATANGIRGAFFKLHRKYIQPQTLSAADHIFISSLDYAQNSSFAKCLRTNENKITELPFGVDTDCYCLGAPNRSRFNMPAGCLVVGTVSVQDKAHQFKGIDLLIKAMADLPKHMHLLLVGDGNMRAQYKALAIQMHVADRVHFTGRLSSEELLCAYRTMDVFAFPSINGAEAFGLALLEAMSCGNPVVASDLPGVRKVAEGGGLLVQPNNPQDLIAALTRLANDPELRRRLGEAARAKAVKYNWDNHVEGLIRTYQQLCA
ncbi:glycosyltransferase, partial [Candidatus Uhrbacteria bacterium]|nr:glycosyltransferase [Candidatus Uhrbacteria bacterium]